MEQLQQQLASSADTGAACSWAPVSHLLTWKPAASHGQSALIRLVLVTEAAFPSLVDNVCDLVG